MQPAKETASNIAASAKSGMDKTKAVAQEQVDKVSAHGPMGKEMAREKKDARVAEAEATKREAKMQNAAARQGEQSVQVMSGDAVELNADGGASGKPGKVGLNVAESEAATVKVVACSGAETLVDSAVNGLKEKAEGDEEVSMVELIDELKDAVEFSREQGGEEDEMSNQKNSNMEDFHDAVDDALDEVSRRVEFGLSCPCVAEHSRIRTQLLAFSRWKGFPELPELQVLGTVLNEAEAEADVPLSDRKENVSIIERDDKHGLSIKTYSSKRKRDSVVEGEQLPAKKERTLADYIAEMRSLKSNGKGKLNREETVKSAGKKKKRKAANSDAGFGFGAKKKRHDLSTPEGSKNIKRHDLLTLEEGSKNMVVETSCPKGSFGIGYSILKVVSQMNSPSPILKSHTVSSRKSKEKKGSKTEEKKKVSKTKEKKKKKGSEKKSAKPRSKRAPEDLDKGSDEVPESQVNSPPDVPNQKHREEASKVETEMQDEQEEGTEEENLSEGNGNSKVETEMQDEQEEGTDEENFPEGNEINGEARTQSDEVIQDIELLQLGAEQGDDASVPEQQNCDEYVDCVDAVKEQQELQSSVLGSA
uniref:Late embryogenesis abundant group 1 n=1 Tax=Linum usitatissimum TaxID=4006 RepID=I6Y9Q1_LINUS|nr:late embryogenesis abundant group 1 [Linum usitatissimum]